MKGNYQNLLDNYQSIYTGEQIDERLTKAGTAVQGVTVDGVPQPKDADGIVNLPQLPTTDYVDAKVAEEQSRAESAESGLQSAIKNEAQRATAKEGELQAAIDAKQPIIADLDAIRQGAAKGATAVQHADLLDYYTKEEIEAAYATKIDLNKKIERVELWYNQSANSICLLGSTAALTYEQIAAYVNDNKKFVTLLDTDGEYLLPQWNDGAALIFTGLNVLSYGTWAHRIAINADNDIKAEYYELANADALAGKQDALVSGENIKTINEQSILGAGNIEISGLTPEQEEKLDNAITARDAEGSGVPALPFLTDAPTDGKQYARQNGEWTEVVGGGGGGTPIYHVSVAMTDEGFRNLPDEELTMLQDALEQDKLVGSIIKSDMEDTSSVVLGSVGGNICVYNPGISTFVSWPIDK